MIQSLRPSDFAPAFGRAVAAFRRRLRDPRLKPWGTWKQGQVQKQIPFGDDKQEKQGQQQGQKQRQQQGQQQLPLAVGGCLFG